MPVRRAFQPIRLTKIVFNHAPDSCILKLLRVSPKREFAHFYWLYSTQNNVCTFSKSMRVFMNGNKSLTLGLYHRIVKGFLCGRSRVIKSAVCRSYSDFVWCCAQNRSLTCGKDRARNWYSLNNNDIWHSKPVFIFLCMLDVISVT